MILCLVFGDGIIFMRIKKELKRMKLQSKLSVYECIIFDTSLQWGCMQCNQTTPLFYSSLELKWDFILLDYTIYLLDVRFEFFFSSKFLKHFT